jgi:hypothetical protein
MVLSSIRLVRTANFGKLDSKRKSGCLSGGVQSVMQVPLRYFPLYDREGGKLSVYVWL